MALDPISIPAELARAAKERRLLPFIGSGFSRNISPTFPTWEGIVEIAAELLDFDPGLLKMHGDYLQIAEYLKQTTGLGELVLKLATSLDDDKKHDVSKSRPHILLPYLDCGYIFTTNWDRWIERAFVKEGVCYSQVRSAKDLITRRVIEPAQPPKLSVGISPISTPRVNDATKIVKFHGDLSEVDSLVLAEESYFKRLAFEDPLDILLRAEILGRVVIFIGYSFTDINVRLMWFKLRQSLKGVDRKIESYFVTAQYNPVIEPVMIEQGIIPIYLDAVNVGGSVTELLEGLIAEQEAVA